MNRPVARRRRFVDHAIVAYTEQPPGARAPDPYVPAAVFDHRVDLAVPFAHTEADKLIVAKTLQRVCGGRTNPDVAVSGSEQSRDHVTFDAGFAHPLFQFAGFPSIQVAAERADPDSAGLIGGDAIGAVVEIERRGLPAAGRTHHDCAVSHHRPNLSIGRLADRSGGTQRQAVIRALGSDWRGETRSTPESDPTQTFPSRSSVMAVISACGVGMF